MKCKECGKTFEPINKRDFVFSAITKKAARGYHPCSRMVMKKQRDWTLYLSVHDEGDMGAKSNTPHPICPDCFKKKLKRFIVAMEIALENKGIKVDDDAPEADQKPEEQQPKAPEITAEEVRRDYPEWCAKLKAAANGREVDDGTLLEIFLKHRKHGMV